jgi:hypothetical protein
MGKTKKLVQIIFPDPTKICTKLRVYLRLRKKKREIMPLAEVIKTEISGPVYRVSIGQSYEVVTNKINHKVHSGRFTVRENEIEIDKKQPPPIVPILLK